MIFSLRLMRNLRQRLSTPVVLSIFFFFTCHGAAAQSRIDCSALNSRILNRVVRYCVYLPAGYDAGAAEHPSKRYPVLYFLHGLGGNEQTFFTSGGWTLLDDLHRQGKIGDFLIATPDARRSFYVNSADGSVRYSDFFIEEFIPYIENKYRTLASAKARAISGVSMGGYGALRFAFAHPELFSDVSAQSPALITDSPRQLDAEAQAGNRLLADVFGQPINERHWNENNPFLLARKNAQALKQLAIYFNCGQHDDFGFERGASQLHNQLQMEGIKHEYHAYPGDHSLTYFLAHFPEVMEFHSKAFGLLTENGNADKNTKSDHKE